MITQNRLREVLDYNTTLGVWTWKTTLAFRGPAGSAAGYINNCGYRMIQVDDKMYQSSRLAFLYMEGDFPEKFVDHIDGNRSNDIWNNLRKCSNSQNQFNRGLPNNNTSGTKGVSWHKRKEKWIARICVNKKEISLGQFTNKKDAIQARKNAEYIYESNFQRQ